ncbi:MAG: DUF4249 domain-containing protein [Bacteroidales bacterium]|nr:DUF4249 domain-containing protein [Bacteroidales bacterium]
MLYWKKLVNNNYISQSIFFCAFLAFFLSSCGKELEIEIEIPANNPKLVVNSTLVPYSLPGGKYLGIELGSSTSIFDTVTHNSIIDASVLLFKNNDFKDTLQYNPDNGLYSFGYGPFEGPSIGDKYTIEVFAEGYEQVWAETKIPEKVEIIEANIIPVAFINDHGGVWSEVVLTFDDPGNINNYYEIVVVSDISDYLYDPKKFSPLFSHESFITGESYYPSPLRFDLKEPKHLLFNDNSFNGEDVTLSFYYYPPQFMTAKRFVSHHIVSVQLRNITEEYYLFKTSFLQSLYNQKEDILYGMGEPLNVFSNIENGYGIFAGFNESIVQILIPETIVD